MSPHADAFVAAILADPAEVTTRLAFADLLDESGDPANTDWASYIRMMTEADTHPNGSFERENCLWRAANLPTGIRATLELPAAFFVAHQHPLRRLLPAERFRVGLGGFTAPPEAVGAVSEMMARYGPVLPLALRGDVLFLALPDPENWDRLITLGFSLRRELLAVGAATGELAEAVNRHYPVPSISDFTFDDFVITDPAIELAEPVQVVELPPSDPPSFRLDLGARA
jgi:uncharacterized protein (TIGR02996 family)